MTAIGELYVVINASDGGNGKKWSECDRINREESDEGESRKRLCAIAFNWP
jgi:hypothetical protein